MANDEGPSTKMGNLKPSEILNQFKDTLEVLGDMEIQGRNPDMQPTKTKASGLSIITCHVPNKTLNVSIFRLQGVAAAHLDHPSASRKTVIFFKQQHAPNIQIKGAYDACNGSTEQQSGKIKRQSHVFVCFFFSFSPCSDHSKLSDDEKMWAESSLPLRAPTWHAHWVSRCLWFCPYSTQCLARSHQLSHAPPPPNPGSLALVV